MLELRRWIFRYYSRYINKIVGQVFPSILDYILKFAFQFDEVGLNVVFRWDHPNVQATGMLVLCYTTGAQHPH